MPTRRAFRHRLGGSGFVAASPNFSLPLADAGSGAVDTALSAGTGAATFTRATAAASRLSTGLWKLDVASGVARSHYHEFSPGVMTYGGFLPEPAATQLALLPRDMTNAAWAKGATITVAKTGTGMDGVVNSCSRLTGGAVAATNTVFQTLAAAATSRTYSAWIKRVTGTGVINITQNGGTNYTDVTALINSTTFTQVQLNASVLNAAFGIQVVTSTDVILVDCNQFEAGAVATTPIPAAGTRNADILTYPFTGNADAAQGAGYAELASLFPATNVSGAAAYAIEFGSSNFGSVLILSNTGATTGIVVSDSTTAVSKTGISSMTTGVRKRASSWGASGLAVTGDGAAPGTNATFDGSMGGTLTNIAIGSNGSTGQWFGTLMNVRLWLTPPTDDQLSLLTA